MDDELIEPLKPDDAKQAIRRILSAGLFTYSRHAMEEMLDDELTTVDCENILRRGVVRPPDFEKGSWRYRVETSRMAVVITFRSSKELVVVTAWRVKS
jgi:hypothetical protein